MNATLVLKDAVYSLTDETISIGRDVSNSISIGDVLLSRHHSLLTREGESYRIKDLDSLNGTFVNGDPVTERLLEHGDKIAIGNSPLLFLLGDEPRALPGPPEGAELFLGSTLTFRPEESAYVRPERLAALPPEAPRDLRVLLEASRLIASARSLSELARKLLDLVLEAVPADRAALLLSGHRPKELFPVAGRERSLDAPSPVLVSRTVVERVLNTSEGFITNDVREAPGLGESSSLVAAGTRALAAVPLLASGSLVGLLYVDSASSGTLREAHVQLLMGIANLAAVSLPNVRQAEWLEEERRRLEAEGAAGTDLVGESDGMLAVYKFIARVAPAEATVLLLGESGTGKELVARALHRKSARNERAFVAINCAVLGESLLENELFGHERGAFTGAISQKKGKLELADGGTLFLDEVGELPLTVQAKLLRVLEEREFERVGGARPIHVDIRLIAATNRNLRAAMEKGEFREDLYYRLDVVSQRLPPLRERLDDIPLLASLFVTRQSRKLQKTISGLSPAASDCLLRHDWPGNVRELSNAIERAIVLGEGPVILPEDLPEAVLERGRPGEGSPTPYHEAVNEAKRQIVLEALSRSESVAEAARRLGLHPNNLHRLIRNLNLKAEVRKG